MSSGTNPGVYPGNPSLPKEVKEKILSTFRHTLNLFHEGKLDDCVIGCDFILKMDARFAPARQLLEKAKNPNANIDLEPLEAIVATTPTRQERVVAADPDRLLVRAVESFNARDFDAATSAAQQVLAVLPGNQDALEILDKAQRKKAAQPVFDGSRQRALAALAADRKEDARRELNQMKELDPDHPAVALLERRIGPPPAAASGPPKPPPPPDFGGLSLDMPAETGQGGFGTMSEPDIRFDDGSTVALKVPAALTPPAAPPHDGGLDSLSLDSLSLDLPPPMPPLDVPSPARTAGAGLGGPLSSRAPEPETPPGSPADMWGEPAAGMHLEDLPEDGGPEHSIPPSPPDFNPNAPMAVDSLEPDEDRDAEASEREIEALLRQGDDAARRGDRQQAIEIWSRIFLIDINNSEAVTRIERARQDMAEGNRKISDGLKTGREAYEAGDLNGARELFLQVLAVDENEPTARFYLDRIQEEIANPGSTSAAATKPGDDLDLAGGPGGPASRGAAGSGSASGSASASAASASSKAAGRTLRLPFSPKILMIVGGFLVMVAALVYFFVLRAPKRGGTATAAATGKSAPAAAGSLAHARELLGAGKIGEARQELHRVPPSSPEFADARRMLADLGKAGPAETGPSMTVEGSTGTATAATSETVASPAETEAAHFRAAAERALAQKHYIEAMKNFSQSAAAFKNDRHVRAGNGRGGRQGERAHPGGQAVQRGRIRDRDPDSLAHLPGRPRESGREDVLAARLLQPGRDPAAKRPLPESDPVLRRSPGPGARGHGVCAKQEIRGALHEGRPRPDGSDLRAALEPPALSGREQPDSPGELLDLPLQGEGRDGFTLPLSSEGPTVETPAPAAEPASGRWMAAAADAAVLVLVVAAAVLAVGAGQGRWPESQGLLWAAGFAFYSRSLRPCFRSSSSGARWAWRWPA